MIGSVFSTGLRRALRFKLLLPLYVCGLLLGLVQSWPLIVAAMRDDLRTPLVANLAAGDIDMLFDMFLGAPETAGVMAGIWLFVTPGLLAIFGLAYNFFSGGILSAYAGQGSFWAACRRTFWSFTGLGMLLVGLFFVVAIGTTLVGSIVGWIIALAGAASLLLLINLLGEYARAIAVVSGRRNPFALLGMAASFCARNLVGTLALALFGLALQIVAAILYRQLSSVVSVPLLVIAGQQLLVLGWLWIKLLRLAWAVSYVQAVDRDIPRG